VADVTTGQTNDYVVSTGESHSVREFLEAVFFASILDWREYVEIDSYYFRPQKWIPCAAILQGIQ